MATGSAARGGRLAPTGTQSRVVHLRRGGCSSLPDLGAIPGTYLGRLSRAGWRHIEKHSAGILPRRVGVDGDDRGGKSAGDGIRRFGVRSITLRGTRGGIDTVGALKVLFRFDGTGSEL